ncbi:hypothetical protein T4D_6390 [Trichinella pseudospiralis]|uniref:Uncharacterized protein n=1 Tax=Trichinella pseudospiralis TaxID=6337 RepID=A0A0V1FZF4_TRIPS|nr:hypothetical protein T4D_6390 [Trichinella pseudospiralis]
MTLNFHKRKFLVTFDNHFLKLPFISKAHALLLNARRWIHYSYNALTGKIKVDDKMEKFQFPLLASSELLGACCTA